MDIGTNDPVNLVDLSGYDREWPEWLMGIAVVVVGIGCAIYFISPGTGTAIVCVAGIIAAIGGGYRLGEKI